MCEHVRVLGCECVLQVFGETVGRLTGSFLAQERGFESREREFRRDMDTLHSSTHNELSLQVSPHSIPFVHCLHSILGGTVSRQADTGGAAAVAGSV